MHPGKHAEHRPDATAAVLAGSEERLSYRELDERSNQLAHLMWHAGLRPGDGVAILLENNLRYFECYWAALRSGLYLTTINRHLTAAEAAYIVGDSGARALLTSHALADLAVEVAALVPGLCVRLAVDGPVDGFEPHEAAISAFPTEPLRDQPRGELMLYSSGTTGRPKGIKRPLSGESIDRHPGGGVEMLQSLYGLDDSVRYLSPAPMYHSAPLGYTTAVQATGGTVVLMEQFDPVDAIDHLDHYDITHSQWVPTMFSRMLKLPREERDRLRAPNHRVAIHAAAPCPIDVKRRMFSWWGPILYEYYAGTEYNGYVFCTPEEWLARPGTVGKAIFGTVRICDDEGNELPAGEPGTVYFEQDTMPFEYHNDPDQTDGARHPIHPGWSTLGDIGHLDGSGFLYLTDRRSFMIISGGVNIYPQEIEDTMVLHPDVADVAVIGVPDEEMGEQVKAIVQPSPGVEPSAALEEALLTWTRQRIAPYKAPRSIDFTATLPRLPTGKLYKRLLKESYWTAHDPQTPA